MNRLALIVVDAAEGSFVRELAEDGELPAIAGLIERGTWCPLRTADAYRSEYSCTEFLTSRSAATNRYWGHGRLRPSDLWVRHRWLGPPRAVLRRPGRRGPRLRCSPLRRRRRSPRVPGRRVGWP